MIALDTSILVAAHRQEHPRHETALACLVDIAEGLTPWGLPIFCIPEFIRVVTHGSIFTPPTSLPVAIQFIDQLLESPSTRLLLPGDRFWDQFRSLARLGDARGNLAFDAQIAAVCLEHGALSLITGDRDFSRFPQLRTEFL